MEEEIVVTVEKQQRWSNLADPRDDDGGESSTTRQNIISEENSDDFCDEKASEIDITKIVITEIDEETGEYEVMELEFKMDVDEAYHTPSCPHCRTQITKVILYRERKRSAAGDSHDASEMDHEEISKIVNDFVKHKKVEDLNGEKVSVSNIKNETGDYQVMELEFGMAVVEDYTHTLYCPKCSSQITKVILHRKRNRPLVLKSLEALKCIVYGGLIESITSLSVITCADASDATTQNIVVIGLATLLTRLFAFLFSLVELRNDNSNDKYHELLGQRGHFLFHLTFAILSFIIFGLVAPITYGFAFHDSDDKDYKMLVVAAAGFGCIFVLAIAKAYVKGIDRFGGYIKTVLYYVTMMAVSAFGIAYAAGALFGKLLDDLGWYQSPQVVATQVSSY